MMGDRIGMSPVHMHIHTYRYGGTYIDDHTDIYIYIYRLR